MDVKRYVLGNTIIKYLIHDTKRVIMLMLPKDAEHLGKEPWNTPNFKGYDARAKYMHAWDMGLLAHFHTSDAQLSRNGITMKNSQAELNMKLESQEYICEGGKAEIITKLANDIGYVIIHSLTYYEGLRGFEIETRFENHSGRDTTLEMLTSFSLDNLSVFQEDDAPNCYNLHRFYGGWSMEGKHSCMPIEELSLEKSWFGAQSPSEKFGCMGSYPVNRYFPTAAFEDKKAGVFWAAQLANNSTWQMELTRNRDTFSFSGGLGDNDFCGWSKCIKDGEGFSAPKAYVATVMGDIYDACNALCDMQKAAYYNCGEENLAITYNEFCTTWGYPTQERMLSLSNALDDCNVKYMVIDAGWCKKGSQQDSNGEWNIDKTIFPDMRALSRELKLKGMKLGIWFEFEVTTKGSPMFEADFDEMHLKHNGYVVKNNGFRSYWDFRRKDVQEYLTERVIEFLKEYEIGYIKVDYNGDIGKAVDGTESGPENLRQHLAAVRDFFKKLKEEIPDLVIENCASGGHRSEPSMMEVSTLTSFSDVHEGVEIPYVAANMHCLMFPAQELIWAVLHEDDSRERLIYSLAATFMGRMCLSGDVDMLNPQQKEILKNATEFYDSLDNIILNGDTKIYGNRGRNMRYPQGTQVFVRATKNEMLVVCHGFENAGDKIEITIPDGFAISKTFYSEKISVKGQKLVIDKMNDFTAEAVLLER